MTVKQWNNLNIDIVFSIYSYILEKNDAIAGYHLQTGDLASSIHLLILHTLCISTLLLLHFHGSRRQMLPSRSWSKPLQRLQSLLILIQLPHSFLIRMPVELALEECSQVVKAIKHFHAYLYGTFSSAPITQLCGGCWNFVTLRARLPGGLKAFSNTTSP